MVQASEHGTFDGGIRNAPPPAQAVEIRELQRTRPADEPASIPGADSTHGICS